jgi:DNA-directed RNA polymerase subunit RPC12/RpoP
MDNEIISQYNQYQDMLDNYASIVEKTNQHLSIWVNPYGIMVGVLTLIVAIMAVVVAWYIWKNSKEQKDLFKKSLRSHQEILNAQAVIFKEQIQKQIEKSIQDLKNIKDIQDSANEKNMKIQEQIDELTKKKEELVSGLRYGVKDESYSVLTRPFFITDVSLLSDNGSIYCVRCGRQFYFSGNKKRLGYTITKEIIHCPYCNAENLV